MELYTLIKGEELYDSIAYHKKAFAIGSQIQWGNKVWEIVKATDDCKGCYFYGSGRCYCSDYWSERLGSCTKLVRPDGKNVVFKLKRV